jgi:NADH:ubiquinone oxidoreductase subunit 2 (subunit N)
VIDFYFTAEMFIAILPELGLLILAELILVMEFVLPREKRRMLGWLTAGGLFLIVVVSLIVGRPGPEPVLLWGGMVRFDWLAFIFKMIFLFGAAITALFAMDVENLGERGEFYLLLLVATMGMGLMAAAGDLILLYLAIETTSIPLYVLAGFMLRDKKSTESGFKYLFFGALTSTIMLYGFSLLYGFAGTTSIYDLASGHPGRWDCIDPIVWILAACPGWFWLQNFGSAFPFLGSGCIRRSAYPGDRFSFYGFKGCRLCRPDEGSAGGIP